MDLYYDSSQQGKNQLRQLIAINYLRQKIERSTEMYNAMNSSRPRGVKKSRVDIRENRALFSMEEETAIPEAIRRYRDDSGKIISAEAYEAMQKNAHGIINGQPVPVHAPKVYASEMQDYVIYSDQIYISGIQTRLSSQQAYSDIAKILILKTFNFVQLISTDLCMNIALRLLEETPINQLHSF